ncbi:uncharacterized protein LAJ45_05747 [Morchella importuna]|uniref:MFS general substrate transporter n=1 Tax=Morchella conica CCBAS932 TaxID=1392247 RepID=A0A3N4KIH5_9PEZI|nr:uncharacterized protein LAJ45_05747 [Morchella importuna]KAH8150061.1 hypothetical protein LAJ45_05747 [Morchella importuna]RPB08171.1 MFS general substrate transporter [Morchella conica CCBAS932]
MQSLRFWQKKQQQGNDAVRLRPPILLKFRSSKTFIICAVAMAIFTDIFLYGLVVPVFPFALESRANIHPDDVQTWVSVLLAVYGGGLLVASPICGYFADRTTTRRGPLLCGLAALAASTIMLCIGKNIVLFILGRLFQGISAAIVWVVGLALLVDTVGKDEIARSMGIVSAALSAATFLAPLLGGIVYDRGGYYAVFAMAFVLIGVDILWRLVLIEKKVAMLYTVPLDVNEQVEVSLSPNAVSTDKEEKEAKPDIPNPKDTGIAGFTTTNKKSSKLPAVITLLRYPRLLAALWACMAEATLLTSLEASLPLYTHENFHFGPVGAGLIFLAIVVPALLAPLVGWVCDKYSHRWIETTGFILCCPFFILLRLPTDDSTGSIVLMCALLALLGVSFIMITPPAMAEITFILQGLEEKKPGRFGNNGAYAQGYGLYNVAWSAGTLVGPLWAGFVKDAAGWGTMTWSLGLLSFVTVFPTAYYTSGKLNFRTDFRITKKKQSAQADGSGSDSPVRIDTV